jgi:hypothetical protein
MDSRADRAIVVRLVRRMLDWILLGQARFRRRNARDGGAACKLFEMEVSERKDKLQRHRCKGEPSAPLPIGTNPTQRTNPRSEQSTAEPISGNTFPSRDRTGQYKLAGLLPKCNKARLADFATGRQHFASEPRISRFLWPVIQRSPRAVPAKVRDDGS